MWTQRRIYYAFLTVHTMNGSNPQPLITGQIWPARLSGTDNSSTTKGKKIQHYLSILIWSCVRHDIKIQTRTMTLHCWKTKKGIRKFISTASAPYNSRGKKRQWNGTTKKCSQKQVLGISLHEIRGFHRTKSHYNRDRSILQPLSHCRRSFCCSRWVWKLKFNGNIKWNSHKSLWTMLW